MTGAPAGTPAEVVQCRRTRLRDGGTAGLQGEPRQPETLQEPVDQPYGVRDPSSNLDSDILRADAARYHSIYGVYGISVFAVRDVTVDELAQQVPLVRFDRLSLLRVRDVLAAGMRLEPTGRNPRHFTVSFDDLEDGVKRLASCPHQVMPNAYHDA